MNPLLIVWGKLTGVGNFYDQSKKNIQYVLDPKKAIQTRLMQAVGISG